MSKQNSGTLDSPSPEESQARLQSISVPVLKQERMQRSLSCGIEEMKPHNVFERSTLPLQNQSLASRVLHRHRHVIATAVFNLDRCTRSQRPASRILWSAHYAIKKVHATAIFRLDRFHSASILFHDFSSCLRCSLAASSVKLNVKLTQTPASFLLKSEHSRRLLHKSTPHLALDRISG